MKSHAVSRGRRPTWQKKTLKVPVRRAALPLTFPLSLPQSPSLARSPLSRSTSPNMPSCPGCFNIFDTNSALTKHIRTTQSDDCKQAYCRQLELELERELPGLFDFTAARADLHNANTLHPAPFEGDFFGQAHEYSERDFAVRSPTLDVDHDPSAAQDNLRGEGESVEEDEEAAEDMEYGSIIAYVIFLLFYSHFFFSSFPISCHISRPTFCFPHGPNHSQPPPLPPTPHQVYAHRPICHYFQQAKYSH